MSLRHKNRRVLITLLALAIGMLGLAFAAVPFYRLFCQLTGFGGTPRIELGGSAPGAIGTDTFKVFFNADTSPDLPWQFVPEQRSVTVKAGADRLISYRAKNLTSAPITGTAVFNILPEKAAQYFIKTQCFCFEKQTLAPGQEMDFPVLFYLEPDILKDPDLANLHEITLSYTFYPAGTEPLEPKSARE